MLGLLQDLRFGMRISRNQPGFTAAAVLTLALGIAANTTVFGWIDALLLHPFPGARAGERLASIETVSPTGEFSTTSWRDYLDYRDSLTLTSGVAASLFNAFAHFYFHVFNGLILGHNSIFVINLNDIS